MKTLASFVASALLLYSPGPFAASALAQVVSPAAPLRAGPGVAGFDPSLGAPSVGLSPTPSLELVQPLALGGAAPVLPEQVGAPPAASLPPGIAPVFRTEAPLVAGAVIPDATRAPLEAARTPAPVFPAADAERVLGEQDGPLGRGRQTVQTLERGVEDVAAVNQGKTGTMADKAAVDSLFIPSKVRPGEGEVQLVVAVEGSLGSAGSGLQPAHEASGSSAREAAVPALAGLPFLWAAHGQGWDLANADWGLAAIIGIPALILFFLYKAIRGPQLREAAQPPAPSEPQREPDTRITTRESLDRAEAQAAAAPLERLEEPAQPAVPAAAEIERAPANDAIRAVEGEQPRRVDTRLTRDPAPVVPPAQSEAPPARTTEEILRDIVKPEYRKAKDPIRPMPGLDAGERLIGTTLVFLASLAILAVAVFPKWAAGILGLGPGQDIALQFFQLFLPAAIGGLIYSLVSFGKLFGSDKKPRG